MYFIEGLPPSDGTNVILVVVDTFTKYNNFLALTHPFTALEVVDLFLREIYKLHRAPEAIISDRDKIFTSLFW